MNEPQLKILLKYGPRDAEIIATSDAIRIGSTDEMSVVWIYWKNQIGEIRDDTKEFPQWFKTKLEAKIKAVETKQARHELELAQSRAALGYKPLCLQDVSNAYKTAFSSMQEVLDSPSKMKSLLK